MIGGGTSSWSTIIRSLSESTAFLMSLGTKGSSKCNARFDDGCLTVTS